VINTSKDEWVKIAPYIVVNVSRATPLNPAEEFHQTQQGGGGFDIPDMFMAFLGPERTWPFAANLIHGSSVPSIMDSTNDYNDIYLKRTSHFILKQGERESFIMAIYAFPGHTYKFRTGIYYAYKNNRTVKWIDEDFEATGLTLTVDYYMIAGQTNEQIKKNIDINAAQSILARDIQHSERTINQDPFFNDPSE
jgi:hypothetical protein